MNTTKVNWEEVNLPINNKTINELGVGHYLIETFYEEEEYLGMDEFFQKITEKYEVHHTYLLEIYEISNGLIGVMNGSAVYEYKHETIIKISRLDF